MKSKIALLLLPALLAACSAFGVRSGYEQPRYEVLDRPTERLEVRLYQPRLAAEAQVEASKHGEGRNAAFRLLLDYISGANRDQARISMTAPVEAAEASRRISMTVPVETSRADRGQVTMRFFLPAEFTAETVPEPNDPRVRIVGIPEQRLAALRFSGFRDEGRVTAKKQDLLSALSGTTWQPTSAPVAYFYDPPWTLPFLRRSEVVVAVTR